MMMEVTSSNPAESGSRKKQECAAVVHSNDNNPNETGKKGLDSLQLPLR